MDKITRNEAETIATKLAATETRSKKHRRYKVHVDGKYWTTFGFSHGPRNPNLNIPADLKIPYLDTKQMARCNRTKAWYEDGVRQKRAEAAAEGIGPPPPPPPASRPAERKLTRQQKTRRRRR